LFFCLSFHTTYHTIGKQTAEARRFGTQCSYGW